MNKPLHHRHSSVTIDLQAIRQNYQYLKQQAPGSKVIAVVKADAYGHGAVEVCRALPQADAFAVATTLEAVKLRQAGIQQKIIILGGVVDTNEMRLCLDYQLDVVIHQEWHIDLLLNQLAKIDVWIKFNSGMGRLGFDRDGLFLALKRLQNYPAQVRLMSHLANADDQEDQKTMKQMALCEELDLAEFEWGIANSAGILGWPNSQKMWVRSGIALYGSDPMISQENRQSLVPVMTFESEILAVYHRKAGQTIGYGGTYTCAHDKTIAVVAAGYADGYPRHLKNGYVIVNGQQAPIVGRVSMDMMTIDVDHLSVTHGDKVVLWGSAPLAEEIARLSETISYELFCHAGCHGTRRYINT